MNVAYFALFSMGAHGTRMTPSVFRDLECERNVTKFSYLVLGWGYTHDRRADKNPYPHDRRADKDSYPHDRNVTWSV